MGARHRPSEWRRLQAQLECEGVDFRTPSLVVEPQAPDELRYFVPQELQLTPEPDGSEWLTWAWDHQVGADVRRSPSKAAALAAFIRLGDAPVNTLVAFARSWGPIGQVWRRALPKDFPHFPRSADTELQTNPFALTSFAWEPVEAWRRMARQLAATLRIAARLQRDEIVSGHGPGRADWDEIRASDPQRDLYRIWLKEIYARRPVAHTGWGDLSDPEMLNLQRDALAHIVGLWLSYGGVELVPKWDLKSPRLAIRIDFDRSGGLTGLLALELATTLASPFGVVACAGCGFPYAPEKRRPRPDRRPYCPNCSVGASLAAKREWWRRNRSARPQPSLTDEDARGDS